MSKIVVLINILLILEEVVTLINVEVKGEIFFCDVTLKNNPETNYEL